MEENTHEFLEVPELPDHEPKVTEQDVLHAIETANFRDEHSFDDSHQSPIDLVRFDNTLLHADRAEELKQLIESKLGPEVKEVFNEFGTHESVMADIRAQCVAEIAHDSVAFDMQLAELDKGYAASGQLDRDAAANRDKLIDDLTRKDLSKEPVAVEADRQAMVEQKLNDAYTAAMLNPPWPEPQGKHAAFGDSEPSPTPAHGPTPEPAKEVEAPPLAMPETTMESPAASMDGAARSGPEDDYELDM